jgi:TBC1 domain family member 2
MLTADWASSIDDTDNSFVPPRPRSKPPSSIEHRAEPSQPSRTNISYPIIRPAPSPTGIKPQVTNLVKDLSISLDTLRPPTPSPTTSESEAAAQNTRMLKFKSLLQMPVVPIASLKKLAWNGIPDDLRPMVWQILLGYLPGEASARASTLATKRAEYQRGIKAAFQSEGGLDQAVWHQIRIDVPRTNPHLALYQFEATQKVHEFSKLADRRLWKGSYMFGQYSILKVDTYKVSMISSLRSFKSSCLLISVISSPARLTVDTDPETFDPGTLPAEAYESVEADSFWCLSALLDGIQVFFVSCQINKRTIM